MKRRNLFIIGALTAAITSFSLHAAFGYSYWRHQNGDSKQGWYRNHCNGNEKEFNPDSKLQQLKPVD